MTVKKVVRKISLTLTVVMLLVLGTIFSGYASTQVGTFSLSISETGSKTFTNTSNNNGYIVDQVSAYPTILNSKYDYSEGYAYIHNDTTGRDYGVNTAYYVQENNPAPVVLNYDYIPKGKLVHHWKNKFGGGFRATITTLLNLYG